MFRFSKKILTAFVLATLSGALLHFLYPLLPNPVTALFSPVCESIWEHLKILFWPYLAAALFLTKGGEKGCRAPWLLSLLVLCAAMLVLGWLYHIVLGGESLRFDLCLYVLLMGLGFLLPRFFSRPIVQERSDWLVLLTAALGAAIVLFTFLPPAAVLFADLSGVNTWAQLPC